MTKHRSIGFLAGIAGITVITCASAAFADPASEHSVITRPAQQAPVQKTQMPRGTAGSAHRVGFQLTPMSAIARIWAFHGTYSVWQYADIIAGYVYQNEMLGDAGRAHGHTLALGYRQFFWGGFNLEIEHWIAYNPIESSVNGATYKGWDGWLELMPGYRLDCYRSSAFDLFVLAQVEFGWGTFRTNPPPKMPHDGLQPFVIPLVWLGVRAF